MNKTIIPNCAVEFTMPGASEISIENKTIDGKLKMQASEYTTDLTIHCDNTMGVLAGKKIIVKKALISISAIMLPVMDEAGEKVILFSIEDDK